MKFLREEKIFFDPNFFKPQEHDLSFPTQPTTPSNSEHVHFGQGLSVGNP